MSAGSRLGSDPLARPAAASGPDSARAMRHILEMPAPRGREPFPEEREALYREVAGKFSEAMESLSRLAATAGVWAWSAQPGEGDSLLFLRLLACFVAAPGEEGVDLAAFLREAAELWRGQELHAEPRNRPVLVSLERGFSLALALQAVLESLRPPGADDARPVSLALDASPAGRARVRLVGPAGRFPGDLAGACSGAGDPLEELIRSGAVGVELAVGPAWAGITLIA